jgi:hypothetical protein
MASGFTPAVRYPAARAGVKGWSESVRKSGRQAIKVDTLVRSGAFIDLGALRHLELELLRAERLDCAGSS